MIRSTIIRSIAFFVLALASCASNAEELSYKQFINNNAQSINKIAIGMTKAQLMTVMGDYSTKTPDGKLKNPYKAESSQRDSNTYEVLYFLTRVHPPFTPILDNQSTPVVLKDGIVMGWGRSSLQLAKPE